MDVYLIPTTKAARYELYYEAADDDVVDDNGGDGLFERMKRRFSEMLREAEEWRSRRIEAHGEPRSLLVRIRRRVMGFIVERIAEQRLLWHLRKATEVCACIPTDLSEEDADAIIRAMLRRDVDRHRKWLIIDSLLLIPAAALTIVPGPNVLGLYFTFQVVSHYLSWTGAKKGLAISPWTFRTSPDLSQLRTLLGLTPAERQQHFAAVAARLRLEHLATFLEDVAARPA